jgi:cysteine synthase
VQVDVLVCGVGTGGTITGAGRYMREKNPNIKVTHPSPRTLIRLSVQSCLQEVCHACKQQAFLSMSMRSFLQAANMHACKRLSCVPSLA